MSPNENSKLIDRGTPVTAGSAVSRQSTGHWSQIGGDKLRFVHSDRHPKRYVRKPWLRRLAPLLGMAGWLATILPSQAVSTSVSSNDYRVCALQLLTTGGITAQAASLACARALDPRELSGCVASIEQRTQFAATDGLAFCRRARRPREFSQCVVGITTNTDGVEPSVFEYCSRSLLPVDFAKCVVGLRAEIDFSPNQAMATCIDASDQISNVLPNFVPAN